MSMNGKDHDERLRLKAEVERLAPMLEELQDYSRDETERKTLEDSAVLLRQLCEVVT